MSKDVCCRPLDEGRCWYDWDDGIRVEGSLGHDDAHLLLFKLGPATLHLFSKGCLCYLRLGAKFGVCSVTGSWDCGNCSRVL